jgi:hypothetical protein
MNAEANKPNVFIFDEINRVIVEKHYSETPESKGLELGSGYFEQGEGKAKLSKLMHNKKGLAFKVVQTPTDYTVIIHV